MNTTSILSLRHVDFAYAGGRTVLSDVNLDVDQGGYLMVRGPSGAGKSTMLRLMNRLEEPDAGRIEFHGKALSEYAPPLLRRRVSYIQQVPQLLDRSIRDNLLLPFTFAANKDLERPTDEQLAELLGEFLLDDLTLEHNALNCSVGQSQRLCLARALLPGPEVMLLDEPASALDAESRRMVEDLCERLNRDKSITVVMISHHDYEPRSVAAQWVEVRDGRISEKGQGA